MIENPTVTACLSVYNAELYVGEAIRSILAQTFRDFEFIIIDDGSKDGSKQIIEKFARQDARIRFISRENRGIVTSANEQLSLARGKFIARMDADDVSLPHRFERQLQFLSAHPEVVCCGSKVMLTDPQGLPLRQMPDQLTHDEIDAALLTGVVQAVYHSTTMCRKSALDQIGGYQEFTNIEDLDLFLRLAEIGQVVNLPEVLGNYRQHMQSIGHARMDAQRLAARAVTEAAHRRRGLPLPPEKPVNARTMSHGEQYRKWAWWALGGGNPRSARKYAIRCLAMAPWAAQNWRLMFCALRGR